MKSIKYFLLAFVTIAFLNACEQDTAGTGEDTDKEQVSPDAVKNPSTASGETTEGKMPQIEYRNTSHDFGELQEGEIVTHAFKFKNTGNANLIINSTSPSCGCTAANYTKEPIPPGGEGFIEVTYDSNGRPGTFSKTVTVVSNTKPNQEILTIKGNVINKSN